MQYKLWFILSYCFIGLFLALITMAQRKKKTPLSAGKPAVENLGGVLRLWNTLFLERLGGGSRKEMFFFFQGLRIHLSPLICSFSRLKLTVCLVSCSHSLSPAGLYHLSTYGFHGSGLLARSIEVLRRHVRNCQIWPSRFILLNDLARTSTHSPKHT